MKKIFLTVFALFLLALVQAQGGWPQGEKEIKITLHSYSDAIILNSFRLSMEPEIPYSNIIHAWVNPMEYRKVKDSGLDIETVIPDMNEHYRLYRNVQVPPGYHTYEEIVELADSLAGNFPSICKKVMFGTSIGGRELAALIISDSVNQESSEPKILLDGGIHGDEIGGPENMIRFARDLCLGYGNNPDYTDLINTREIWIYYMVNPDGRANMSRFNENDVDCNRDFGYMWDGFGGSPAPFSQPETKALRSCIFDNQFVTYITYHSGAEVLLLPWNYRQASPPDATLLNYLAYIYVTSSGYPNLPYGQGFTAMYPVNGCSMDSKYGSLGNISYTMEISADKQPPASQMLLYYSYNLPAMVEMIRKCGYGLEGFVTDSLTGKPIRATIWINNFYPVYNDPVAGDYHKFLLQGGYNVKVTANGYVTKYATGVGVPMNGVSQKDFRLVPDTLRYAYRVISCHIHDNNFDDEGYTPGALGAPDSVAYSLGGGGYIVLDMGDTIFNGPGPDLKVFESGSTPEGFMCYAGTTMDGPWISLGSGTGTTTFELGYGSLEKARYIKIVDDSLGELTGPDAGFDLDAVQILHPPLTPEFIASNTALCITDTVNFTDQSGGNPVSWNWSFPGGSPSSSSEQNPSGITYALPGEYDVSLTISNGVSSSSLTKSRFIRVSAAPEQPGIPSGPPDPCNTESPSYVTGSIPYADSYAWELSPANAGSISGLDTTGAVIWNDTYIGTAYIKVMASGSCGSSPWSDSLQVTLRQGPVVNLGNDTTIHVSQSIILDAGNPGSEYLWSTGETTQTIEVDSTGTGFGSRIIWVNVINSTTCTGSDTITITFTPETGLENVLLPGYVEIYPNPSSGKFNVRITGCSGSRWQVFNVTGQAVASGIVTSDPFLIPVDLTGSRGSVFLFRVSGNNSILTKKIIVH